MSVAMAEQYAVYETTNAAQSSPSPPDYVPTEQSVQSVQSVRSVIDDDEQKDIRVYSQSIIGFKLLGIASLILGSADLLIELIAFWLGCNLSYSFSGIWAGFMFALMNGMLLLRVSKAKKDLNIYCTASLLRYGKAALVMHFVDLTLAISSVILFAPTVLVDTYYGSYLENIVIEQSPTTPESARSTVILLLIIVDACGLKLVDRLDSVLVRLQPPSRTHSQLSAVPSQLDTQPNPRVYAQNAAYLD